MLARLALLTATLGLSLLVAASSGSDQSNSPLRVEIVPQWAGRALVFDTAPSAGKPSLTRLDFLVSEVAVRDASGAWHELPQTFEVIKAREGRLVLTLPSAPPRASAVRFSIGLPPQVNARPVASFPAGHALHPLVNGLHWSGSAGFIFLALEGHWLSTDGTRRGFSYHLAGPELPMPVEFQTPATSGPFRVALEVAALFRGLQLSEETMSTHSRPGDPVAELLRRNVPAAFAVLSAAPDSAARTALAQAAKAAPLMAPQATPYRFTYPAHFPQPNLPADNPLTEEGVELGRLLFFDRRLSGNGSQSCATCHRPELAFIDPRGRFSRGAEGQLGTRNSMTLTNLAWNHRFFWDGRAATLREQVLQPIENPLEMNARMPSVLAFLRGEPAYRHHFQAAFGSGEISADRLARALEQYLLTFVAGDTKLDRTLRGGEALTAEEQRGFELFHTEYDPRRGLLGADCFHCHGGTLFRSQDFANNGLDTAPKDWGRALVTGNAADVGKFAVPSLRNVARTAPYMHDGRFATLEEVVAHYAGGVQRSATLDPNLAKHPAGGVPLSAEDQRALVAFLHTLTDDTPPPRPPGPPPRRFGPPPSEPRSAGEERGMIARLADRVFGRPPPPPAQTATRDAARPPGFPPPPDFGPPEGGRPGPGPGGRPLRGGRHGFGPPPPPPPSYAPPMRGSYQ